MEERDLLARASQGDRPALEQLLERHLDSLHAYLRLQAGEMLRRKESVSDLVQSVCCEVLQDADKFDYRGEAQFRKWLYTAALRKVIDKNRYYRAHKRDVGLEVSGPGSRKSTYEDSRLLAKYGDFCTPSKVAIVHEELRRIEEAFQQLPEHYREVITMSRFYRYSNSQIAEELDRTEDAVRMLLGRALARFSSLLERARRHGEQSA
ncbi:MAG: sigma-70 family RNA polymerase sigma factor [Planctomycetota bacterium]